MGNAFPFCFFAFFLSFLSRPPEPAPGSPRRTLYLLASCSLSFPFPNRFRNLGSRRSHLLLSGAAERRRRSLRGSGRGAAGRGGELRAQLGPPPIRGRCVRSAPVPPCLPPVCHPVRPPRATPYAPPPPSSVPSYAASLPPHPAPLCHSAQPPPSPPCPHAAPACHPVQPLRTTLHKPPPHTILFAALCASCMPLCMTPPPGHPIQPPHTAPIPPCTAVCTPILCSPPPPYHSTRSLCPALHSPHMPPYVAHMPPYTAPCMPPYAAPHAILQSPHATLHTPLCHPTSLHPPPRVMGMQHRPGWQWGAVSWCCGFCAELCNQRGVVVMGGGEIASALLWLKFSAFCSARRSLLA